MRAASIFLGFLMIAGCSSGSQHDVFGMQGGYSLRLPLQAQEVENIGLSHGWLYNTTDYPVRLVSVRFTAPPASLHVLNVFAYSWTDTHDTGILGQLGVLSKECPSEFRPHPLSVVTVGPHSNANWLVVIAFTISKPGVYHLDQVRIDYETQGHEGWQYQNIDTTVTVKNPPLPGPTPVPPSSVCYNPKTAP